MKKTLLLMLLLCGCEAKVTYAPKAPTNVTMVAGTTNGPMLLVGPTDEQRGFERGVFWGVRAEREGKAKNDIELEIRAYELRHETSTQAETYLQQLTAARKLP